jgi:diguanylate cyclase (GGDEF)-like protein
LTELQNRRGLQEDLREDAGKTLAQDAKSLVMLVDVDDFKKVNDQWGHDAGDRVLKEIAERLKAGLRPPDHAARIGGDEYLLLLPDTLPSVGLEVAKRLRDTIGQVPFDLPSGPLSVSVQLEFAVMMSIQEHYI